MNGIRPVTLMVPFTNAVTFARTGQTEARLNWPGAAVKRGSLKENEGE